MDPRAWKERLVSPGRSEKKSFEVIYLGTPGCPMGTAHVLLLISVSDPGYF